MAKELTVLSDIEMLDIIRNWRDYPKAELITTIKLLEKKGFSSSVIELLEQRFIEYALPNKEDEKTG